MDWSPEKLVIEGVDRSGILGPLMEYNNMAEKASGGIVGLGALLGHSPVTPAVVLLALRLARRSAHLIPLLM